MKILNISNPQVNDSHNYYGGAAGNIIFNLIEGLAVLEDVELDFATSGTDLVEQPPESLTFHKAMSTRTVTELVDDQLDDADIVTHLYFYEPLSNPVAKRVVRADKPFVIGMAEAPHPRFNDEVSGLLRLPYVRKIGKRLLYMPRFKRTLQRCDRLIVVDENARAHYSTWVPEENIRVIPYGIDLDRFDLTPIPETPRILMVNRLIKRRGIDYMIEALPDVLNAFPNAELDIVGDGKRKGHLKSLADDLGVRDAITFHGNAEPDTLTNLYASASVFVHLSYADGWNQPALEAMASGKPVVCTERPHNSMVYDGETGYKVPWADANATGRRIVKLLTDRETAERFGERGRQLVEDVYNYETIARQYREVFEEVVE